MILHNSHPFLRIVLWCSVTIAVIRTAQYTNSQYKVNKYFNSYFTYAPTQSLLNAQVSMKDCNGLSLLYRYASDHSANGFKLVCQHKLLRSHSYEFPSARYYPPTLLEWVASRKKAKLSLPVFLPKGNFVNCHVDSWTSGEDCAKLAMCAW